MGAPPSLPQLIYSTHQHVTATITALCLGPNLDQYVRDMGDLLFPVDGTHGTGQKAIIDEGIEKGLLSTEDTLLEGHEDGDGEDLGSVDSVSEESGGVESPSNGSEAAEDTAAGESDALSDHMLDESFELF